jgi:hypothetical protein
MFEYLALGVLAAVIIAGIAVSGLGTTLSNSAGTVVCRVTGGADCGKPQAGGNNGGRDKGNPSVSPTPGDTTKPGGTEPTLADLQEQADNAQKAADRLKLDPNAVVKQIFELLKDFTGYNNVKDCLFGNHSISSCLMTLLDVGGLFFAALKIFKFEKAVKDAVKAWKVFKKARELWQKASKEAKRAGDLLKKAKKACGIPLPAAYSIPGGAPPGRVVHASFADTPVRTSAVHALPAAAPAGPKKCVNPVNSVVGKDKYLKKAAQEAGSDEKVQRDLNHLRDELMKGNVDAGIGAEKLNSKISYMRTRAGARLFFRVTKDGYEIVGKASKKNEPAVIKYLLKMYP